MLKNKNLLLLLNAFMAPVAMMKIAALISAVNPYLVLSLGNVMTNHKAFPML